LLLFECRQVETKLLEQDIPSWKESHGHVQEMISKYEMMRVKGDECRGRWCGKGQIPHQTSAFLPNKCAASCGAFIAFQKKLRSIVMSRELWHMR
jgi:hypothetical protein